MKDFAAEREQIRQSPPPALVAEAAANPGGAVAAIDRDYIGHPDGFVPAEAVLGVWLVDGDGKLTGAPVASASADISAKIVVPSPSRLRLSACLSLNRIRSPTAVPPLSGRRAECAYRSVRL